MDGSAQPSRPGKDLANLSAPRPQVSWSVVVVFLHQDGSLSSPGAFAGPVTLQADAGTWLGADRTTSMAAEAAALTWALAFVISFVADF